jgi:hypothetical protein
MVLDMLMPSSLGVYWLFNKNIFIESVETDEDGKEFYIPESGLPTWWATYYEWLQSIKFKNYGYSVDEETDLTISRG